MKIKRTREAEVHTQLVVSGGGKPDKRVPTVGSGIALALQRALDVPVGETVILTEYGDTIYTARREVDASVIYEGALA